MSRRSYDKYTQAYTYLYIRAHSQNIITYSKLRLSECRAWSPVTQRVEYVCICDQRHASFSISFNHYRRRPHQSYIRVDKIDIQIHYIILLTTFNYEIHMMCISYTHMAE